MAQKAAIKSRIKSINATKKITGAMEMIATVKLQKTRNLMFQNREFSETLKATVAEILNGEIDADSEFLHIKDNTKKLVIVFCSDLGLCGGYNMNVVKFASDKIDDDDLVIVVGTACYVAFKKIRNVINEPISSDNVTYDDLKKLADDAIMRYRKNEIGAIDIIFTHFVNNVSFTPNISRVLPSQTAEDKKHSSKQVLLEPNANEILDYLIPMQIENEVYSRWLESKTAEQGARRFAMENATDNAEELTEKLLLAYNQARQAAITQEITEIVSGADAL